LSANIKLKKIKRTTVINKKEEEEEGKLRTLTFP
jgi:hypothetical protein